MADAEHDVATGQPKKRTFKKFSFRGVDLDALLDMSTDDLAKLFTARARRRIKRGLRIKALAKLRKVRKAAAAPTSDAVKLSAFIYTTMADAEHDVATGQPKKRTFKKFSFRDALLDIFTDDLTKLFTTRARRRIKSGLKIKPLPKLRYVLKAKRQAPPGEKPKPVKTHLRNVIIVPEMIGSVIGVYNGKTFNQIEVKPEMIGHYLAEFSISYKPVKHGRPGIGATHSSRFIPLK